MNVGEEQEPMEFDDFVPDYKHKCEVCGAKPVVTGVKNGAVVYQGTMCGPCTWGEASTADPATWNE